MVRRHEPSTVFSRFRQSRNKVARTNGGLVSNWRDLIRDIRARLLHPFLYLLGLFLSTALPSLSLSLFLLFNVLLGICRCSPTETKALVSTVVTRYVKFIHFTVRYHCHRWPTTLVFTLFIIVLRFSGTRRQSAYYGFTLVHRLITLTLPREYRTWENEDFIRPLSDN